MKLKLPKIYPITDSGLSRLTVAQQAYEMALGGAELIQIREKNITTEEFYDNVVDAMKMCRDLGTKIIVNDRVDIAVAAGAHGVHLGQTDLDAVSARRILGESAIIGISTHSATEALEAAEKPVDYIAIGPIFPTASKVDTSPVVGLEAIQLVRKELPDVPLVAIGGIDRSNALSVILAGADSCAVISAILSAETSITTAIQAMIVTIHKKK